MTHTTIQRLLTFILSLILVLNVGFLLYQHKGSYLTQNYWQQFPSLRQAYLSSQYVNKHPKGWIPDETVNAYAGGAYIQGVLPQLIAPDTPPFGRYLAGFSAVLFNNPNILVGFISLCSLFFLFLLGKQIFKNTFLALLPLVFLSFEPIFQNQFIYTPLLDGLQLTFLLASLYFFNVGFLTQKKVVCYLLAVVSLGLFISTKFYITGIIILAAWFMVLLLHKKGKDIFVLSALSPLSVIVLLGMYIQSLWHGYTFMKFLGIQKYIFLYHKSQLILPFSIWPLLFLNKWYVWYGNNPVISDGQWRMTWPLIAGISFLTIIFYFLRKIPSNKAVEVLMIWTVLYILFFSFGEITARYLVIYIPVLYVLALFGIQHVVKKFFLKTY